MKYKYLFTKINIITFNSILEDALSSDAIKIEYKLYLGFNKGNICIIIRTRINIKLN